MTEHIGHITLNLASILYLFAYVPQLWHNQKSGHLASMSFGYHALPLLGTAADLYYAFGVIEQWQYQVVGCLYLSYLSLQHMQWWAIAKTKPLALLHHMTSTLVIALVTGVCLLPLAQHQTLCLSMGWIARIAFACYTVPQIIKNHNNPAQNAISMHFLYLCIAINMLDTITAWSLAWGAPTCYGALICLSLNCVLYFQQANRQHNPATQYVNT
jgi:uncharacterized protein with PQ loop repeat